MLKPSTIHRQFAMRRITLTLLLSLIATTSVSAKPHVINGRQLPPQLVEHIHKMTGRELCRAIEPEAQKRCSKPSVRQDDGETVIGSPTFAPPVFPTRPTTAPTVPTTRPTTAPPVTSSSTTTNPPKRPHVLDYVKTIRCDQLLAFRDLCLVPENYASIAKAFNEMAFGSKSTPTTPAPTTPRYAQVWPVW